MRTKKGLLLILLAAVFPLTVHAQGMKDVLTLQQERLGITAGQTMPLDQKLRQLEEAYDARIFYMSESVQGKYVSKKELPAKGLEARLTQLLDPLQMTYRKLTESSFVVFEREEPAFEKVVLETVTGTVTDAGSEEPLPGVNVIVKGTTMGTSTNRDGHYQLTVPSLQDTLVFSFIGYQTRQVPINGRSTVNVELRLQTISGEELVVVGYGTQKREDLTGAVSSANSEDLEMGSVSSPDQAMQGKLSGVNVFTGSHKPGGGMSVKVRGSSSISAGGSPLYVIDGMPISNVQGGGLGGGRSSNNPLAVLSPSNIESIEVLKGASSTAIYGARGASGVVLITTKGGEVGQSQINYNGSVGFGNITNKLELLNAKEHAVLLNETMALKGQQPLFSETEIANLGEGTDWQDEIFRTSVSQNHNLTYSGGSEDFRYFVGGSYTDEQGIVLNSSLERYSAQINTTAHVTDKLKIQENFQINFMNQAEAITGSKGYGNQGNLIVNMLDSSPTMPVYDENGDYLMPSSHRTGGTTFDNPVFKAKEYVLDNSNTKLIGNIRGTYTFLEGLDLQVSFGLDMEDGMNGIYYPIGSVRARPSDGVAEIGENRNTKILNENLVRYNNIFNSIHSLDFTGGFTYEQYNSRWSGGDARDFPSDYFTYRNLGAAEVIGNPYNGWNDWKLLSFLGRINYKYDDKYLLTISTRIDGSSKFGANSKWGTFPAVALGWRLSNEDFMDNIEVINNLKLRASYGQSGNDRIGTYQSISTIDFDTRYAFGGNTRADRVTMAAPSRIPNPDLGWEESENFDVGLDVGLFEDRISLNMDYYYQKTTDLILDVPLPDQSGFGSVQSNTGAMENKGFEFTLSSYNISRENFSWTTDLNFSANRNKVLDLGANEHIFVGWAGSGNVWNHGRHVARLEAGHPVGAFYGSVMHENSVWKDQAEIDEVGTMPSASPGDYRFVDVNGDGKYTADDDQYVGDPNPDFVFGITNNLSIGNFDVRLFLQGTYGNDILMLTKNELAGGNNLWKPDRDNRWTPDNPRTGPNVTGSANSGPRYGFDVGGPLGTQGYPNLVNTDNVYDGSFMRVKNLRIGYTFPQSLSGLRRARIYVSGSNLLTFTSYPGYDPEVNAATGSNIVKGVDRFPYPAARTFRVGVNLAF